MQLTVAAWTIICGCFSVITFGESQCVFDGATYSTGDVWHPVLHPIGVMPCINCTCLQNGEVTCDGDRCPPLDCESPIHVKDKCCPVCQDNLPPDVSTDSNESDDQREACYHGDKVYKHNDVFPSNTSAIKPTRDSQCVLCICLDGSVICHLKTCLPLSCKRTIHIEEDCCPVCKDEIGELAPGKTPSSSDKGNKKQNDCQSGGETYRNGESWHPVVGHFGQVNCVQCRCKRGEIKCRRLDCLPDDKLQCSNPQVRDGSCCKACPGTDPTQASTQKPSRQRRRRKNSKNRGLGSPPTTASAPRTCMPKGSDILVHEVQNDTHAVWVLHNVETGQEQWMVWTRNRANFTGFEVQSRPTETDLPSTFEIIGAAKKGRLEKFKKNARKSWAKCNRKGRCRAKSMNKLLKKLLRGLRLQRVVEKRRC